MTTASVLLTLIGLLGAVDIAWFHTWKGALVTRPECRREAVIHVVRGFVYAAQFLVVPNLRLTGAWYAALVALFALDVAIAAADVLEEPKSRAKQGGLSGGEYLMHITLSVLVGAMLCALFSASAPWAQLPTGLAIEPHAPDWLRLLMAAMAAGCVVVSLVEAAVIASESLPAPAPIHVRVRIRASLERVWNTTQDHRLHPSWDHRFSRITMLHEEGAPFTGPVATPDPRIGTGTVMRYEKSLGGLVIRGFGRYKLHKPMRQSTFEFWSDDPRSLIRRGVGLWLYAPRADGTIEFATSYTYEVRWGALGRAIDRFLFRPVFQRFTEQSFRRLAREQFADRHPIVLGRAGRRPERFATAEAA